MQPHEWRSVQWCTGKWHLYGGSFGHDYLHDIWQVDFRQICIKPILSYILFKTKHFEILWMTLWNHTMVKSSMGFRIITWLHLPWVFEGWSNFKYIQKRWWDSSVHSLPRKLKLSVTGDTAKILGLLSRGCALSPYDPPFPREEWDKIFQKKVSTITS